MDGLHRLGSRVRRWLGAERTTSRIQRAKFSLARTHLPSIRASMASTTMAVRGMCSSGLQARATAPRRAAAKTCEWTNHGRRRRNACEWNGSVRDVDERTRGDVHDTARSVHARIDEEWICGRGRASKTQRRPTEIQRLTIACPSRVGFHRISLHGIPDPLCSPGREGFQCQPHRH